MQSLKILVCTAILIVPQFAQAEDAQKEAPGVDNYSLGDLDADKQRSLKLENQIEILKKEIQLEELSSKRNGGGEQAAKADRDDRPTETPWVSSISGSKGKVFATIQFPDGSSVTVSEGDSLPKGGLVMRISRSGVAVQQKAVVEIYAMSPAVRRSTPAAETPTTKRSGVVDSTRGGI